MPLSLSHIQFMRRLSIQPEESTDLDLDDEPLVSPGQLIATMNDPNDLPLSPCLGGHGPNNHEIPRLEVDDGGRKFSLASLTSNKSSSSISSTCSAPGLISSSVGRPGGNFSSLSTLSMESYDLQPMTRRRMTSRPSFISLCSIVSETSEAPQRLLPAPLQVELDFEQRSGLEGDEPTCRSHLPILRCPSDYDISEMDMGTSESGQLFCKHSRKGLVKGIKDFPKRMRKLSTEKRRFDIYSISDETREQLKRLYVY